MSKIQHKTSATFIAIARSKLFKKYWYRFLWLYFQCIHFRTIFKTYNYLNKILQKQNLHHRTNSGKDSSNTKIVGVRNAKKSRNTPGLGSMYIERVMRVSRSHGYYVSSSCCFLFLSNGIDFFILSKAFSNKKNFDDVQLY